VPTRRFPDGRSFSPDNAGDLGLKRDTHIDTRL